MMKYSRTFFFLILLIPLLVMVFACRKKDKIDTSPELFLTFSSDTVMFDTVFTTVGSVTKRLIVYNEHDKKVRISTIRLAGGSSSQFSINVDGSPVTEISDVEIPGKDSIFIFVRVTVDPGNQNTPFVIADSILFSTNGNLQDVKLVAWGQDAHFHVSENIKGNTVWDSLKPHVIYGFVRIDTAGSLTIEPGTKVYFHKNGILNISYDASLKVNGNLQHPVRFQGDRLDLFYNNLPGQWDGISLEAGSRDHEINYAIIKNGNWGIAADSAVATGTTALKLDNTIIQNMVSDGLYAFSTSIISTNCVIGNCGGTALDIVKGGNYDFRQLTIGNYWSSSVRYSPSVYISNYRYDSIFKIPNDLQKAYFGNVIIYGSNDEEIALDTLKGTMFEATFDHVLMKSKINTSDPVHFIACLKNQDPLFVDVQNYDYRIDSLSPAIGKGVPMGVNEDIRGNPRPSNPALGAYEFIPGR